MEKNHPNWLKVYIIDVLPGIAVGLYILGYLYTVLYYEAIGIEISKNISLSEMLLEIITPLFFVSLFYVLILLFFGWFHFTSTIPLIKKHKEEKNEVDYDVNRFNIKNKKFLKVLLFSTILPLVIFIGLNAIRDHFYSPSQIFLFPPLVMSFMFLIIFAPPMIISTPNPYRMMFVFEGIVAYFIFTSILFGYCGYINGRYIRDNDIAVFDIKTNDGTIYNNKSYRYTDEVSNRLFLIDKTTKYNVIIGKENVIYMKIKPIIKDHK